MLFLRQKINRASKQTSAPVFKYMPIATLSLLRCCFLRLYGAIERIEMIRRKWILAFALPVCMSGCVSGNVGVFKQSKLSEKHLEKYKEMVYSRCNQVVAVYQPVSKAPSILLRNIGADTNEVWALAGCYGTGSNLRASIFIVNKESSSCTIEEYL